VAIYAQGAKLEVVVEFYRGGFIALLDHCATHDVELVLVENTSRFARDLAVQLPGHALLRRRDIEPQAATSVTSKRRPSARSAVSTVPMWLR
jgi:hypothetical protein